MRWTMTAAIVLVMSAGAMGPSYWPMLRQAQAQLQIEINRPRSPFECDLPIGEKWYGSTDRCLEELCGGRNVYNQYIFDQHHRRRENPCYGLNPTEFRRR